MKKYFFAWLMTITILCQSIFAPILFQFLKKEFELSENTMVFSYSIGVIYICGLCVIAFSLWRAAVLNVDARSLFTNKPVAPHVHDWQPHTWDYRRSQGIELCISCKAERGKPDSKS